MKSPAPSKRWPSDGLPVSSRSADSNGRVIRYTFADGSSYMEPVEPPSEQYINSAAVMVPGGIALSRGKGLTDAARAIAAEAIDDAATGRAGQAANAATGGCLRWIPTRSPRSSSVESPSNAFPAPLTTLPKRRRRPLPLRGGRGR